MTLPSIILGIVISSLYGTIFHLYRGGGPGRLLLYLVSAWIGFWLGQFLANTLGWSFLSLGPLRLGMGTIGSAITLAIGYWLSLVESKTGS
jgi:hypothetical protein